MANPPSQSNAIPDKYYTPEQIELHNSPDDCWVSYHYRVYNLTPLVQRYTGTDNADLVRPILQAAGQDISHWFDASGDLLAQLNPLTECKTSFLPHGRIVHTAPALPRTDWLNAMPETSQSVPWWKDKSFCIGHLSRRTRKLRMINMLTKDEHVIEDRYSAINSHAKGYIWKRLGNILDMTQTLVLFINEEGNGLVDEGPVFERLGMDEDQYLPAIHLYFRSML